MKDKMKSGFSGSTWAGAPDKGYKPSFGYKWLKGNLEKKWWDSWVWCKLAIPKHSFITWLAVNDRLRTKDKLLSFGMNIDSNCLLCGEAAETSEHLFYRCKYTQMCLDLWKQALNVRGRWQNLMDSGRWCLRRIRGAERRKMVLASLNGLIYSIWMQRNQAFWSKKITHPRTVVSNIINDVNLKVSLRAKLNICNNGLE